MLVGNSENKIFGRYFNLFQYPTTVTTKTQNLYQNYKFNAERRNKQNISLGIVQGRQQKCKCQKI